MASPVGGAAAAPLDDRRLHEDDEEDSVSGSSHIGSDAPDDSSTQNECRWRTAQFHDMECSRFFDCPTHLIERRLSDDEADESDESDEGEGPPSLREEPNDRPESSQGTDTTVIYSPGQNSTSFAPGREEINAEPSAEIAGTAQATSARNTDGSEESQDPEEAAPTPSTPLSSRLSESSAHAQPLPPTATPAQPTGEFVTPDTSSSLVASQSANASSQDLPAHPVPATNCLQETPPATPRRSGSSAAQSATRSQQSSIDSIGPPEFILPRWQPDADVTFCPICHTQFSIFVRKHHCRKCGRVVCNSCSPHRITIPYQYIVQPPGAPRLAAQRYPSSLISGEGGYADFSSIGGGERVRLCNPCVPDPNTTPPQPLDSPSQLSPRASHHRSQSSYGSMSSNTPQPSRFSGYLAAPPPQEAYARSRSITHSGSGGSSSSRGHGSFSQNRILTGTPPTYYPSSSSGYPGSSRYRSMLDVGPSSSTSAIHNRALPPPPPPPPQIPEEDECPVCHRELPSRSLPNFEVLRETHINTCITSHSTYSGTPAGESPQNAAGSPPPLAVRRTGMFPYVATEKDCVDSAECTICLEEFEHDSFGY
ncbi:RUN and FYVE domain-containing protein 2 [Colletotrichum chlorophyti]|uniref:RUN and FYVE domain-containing protein 2 n=1 Tax=Colletotrichum chlorophyti TaxID=708187 RepID=A0A1Q8RVI6_9PEZI|nr:RUN and FYVE domain-containing protein 2 [Colletotrichum chlorophyti]